MGHEALDPRGAGVIDALKKLATVALLPLSLLPVVLGLPKVEEEYEHFRASYVDRDPLPAPEVAARNWAPVRVPAGRVPVVVYHGICLLYTSPSPRDRG